MLNRLNLACRGANRTSSRHMFSLTALVAYEYTTIKGFAEYILQYICLDPAQKEPWYVAMVCICGCALTKQ
ncbi:hypothetical protein D5086_001350 [Populus alba]|uniref:Uncharacterized protein n=1 Tax=Populus alba TaxID=43335 RepID=A0ACC4CZN0_POPAL